MRLLLDTHTAIWWLEDAPISEEARSAIENEKNEVFLSAASIWEIALKQATGRLALKRPLVEAARAARLTELAVTWSHGGRAAALPPHHTDPFDRMLVAQALEEKLVLVTRDPLVRQYPVATLAA